MKNRRRLPFLPALVLCAAVIVVCQVLKNTDLEKQIARVMGTPDNPKEI